MLLVLLGSLAEKPSSLVHAGFALSLVTLFLMVCLRYLLRLAYLKPYANLGALVVRPQTGVIVLFLLLFVGGLATVGYMLWMVGPERKNARSRRCSILKAMSADACVGGLRAAHNLLWAIGNAEGKSCFAFRIS
jgi:hypothetical protein